MHLIYFLRKYNRLRKQKNNLELNFFLTKREGRNVVVNVLDNVIEVRAFKLQSSNYFHFRVNNLARCWTFVVCVCVGLHTRFPTRPEENENKVRSQGSQQKSGKGDGQRKVAAERERSWDLRTQRPNRRAREDESVLLIAVKEFLFECTPVTGSEAQNATKMPKASPFLRLGLTQVRACLFFFLPLSVIYVVSVGCL